MMSQFNREFQNVISIDITLGNDCRSRPRRTKSGFQASVVARQAGGGKADISRYPSLKWPTHPRILGIFPASRSRSEHNMISPQGSSVRVLIADDSPTMRKLIRQILEDEPFVQVVGDVGALDEALEMAADKCPDILLLDLHLSELASFAPARIRIGFLSFVRHILAMSTRSDTQEQDAAASYGASRLLDKFWLMEQLVPAILSCTRVKKPARPPLRRSQHPSVRLAS
jgi:CheY-like chemotaxis protein